MKKLHLNLKTKYNNFKYNHGGRRILKINSTTLKLFLPPQKDKLNLQKYFSHFKGFMLQKYIEFSFPTLPRIKLLFCIT